LKPRRRADVLMRRVGDEVVAYDPTSHVAHCLSPAAAMVFEAADGTNSVDAIAAVLSARTAVENASVLVSSSLEQLAAAGLLEPLGPELPSRRRALRNIGLGAVALAPIVTSLVVPTPAEAAATCVPQSQCTAANPGQPCFVLATSECLTKLCTGVSNVCQ
jgi:hypothetical protein